MNAPILERVLQLPCWLAKANYLLATPAQKPTKLIGLVGVENFRLLFLQENIHFIFAISLLTNAPICYIINNVNKQERKLAMQSIAKAKLL